MAETSAKGELGRRLAQKALMPIVATAASAAAGYAAKKGPDLFEVKVLPKLKQSALPKLKQAAGGASSVAEDLPSRAKSVVGNVSDLTDEVATRVKEAAPGGGGRAPQRRNGGLSPTELERHVKRRAQARAARRKATSKS
jgi:hypothetical protein